ncbi:MAG: ribbon-helix-helix domain-containing protein [Sulfolobales archaeon]
MSEDLRRELERFADKLRSEIDTLISKVEELRSKGEFSKAYRLLAEGAIDILKKIKDSLEEIESYTKKVELSESEIKELIEYLRKEIKDALSKIEEEAFKLRDYGGRAFVLYLPAPEKIVKSITTSVSESIGDVVESVSRLIESLQDSLDHSLRKVTQVVSLRMKEKDLEVIDQLVEARIFKSRSEAIAYFARKGIESSREWINKALEQAKKIRELQESIRRELEEEHGEDYSRHS